jgi:hypothetical protein
VRRNLRKRKKEISHPLNEIAMKGIRYDKERSIMSFRTNQSFRQVRRNLRKRKKEISHPLNEIAVKGFDMTRRIRMSFQTYLLYSQAGPRLRNLKLC